MPPSRLIVTHLMAVSMKTLNDQLIAKVDPTTFARLTAIGQYLISILMILCNCRHFPE